MANPQPDKFIRLSTELYEAIMRFDFSKRQRNILDLIIRFSYGCGKKTALLRPSDFQQCGVGKNHIKRELETLAKANVIFLDGEVIQLNKNFKEWAIKIVPWFDQKKWSEILKRNLAVPKTGTEVPEMGTKVPETGTGVPEMGTGVPETGTEVPETGTEVPETGTKVPEMGTDENMFGSQNGNSGVPKMGTDTPPNPSNDAGFEPRIDNIIDKLFKKDDDDEDNIWISHFGIDEEINEKETDPLSEIRNYFVNKSERWPSFLDEQEMVNLLDKGIPVETIKRGIDLAFERFVPKFNGDRIKTFRYCVDAIKELHEAEKRGGDGYHATRSVQSGRNQEKDRSYSEVDQGYYEQYEDTLFYK